MNRRNFIKTSGSALLFSTVTACTKSQKINSFINIQQPSQHQRLFIDGLSFIPKNHADVKSSQINAFIADISEIEAIKMHDGSTNYKRTYKACIKSIEKNAKIVAENPDVYLMSHSGKDINKALKQEKCAVYFQIQGADCIEEDLEQLNDFYDYGLRVLQLTHHYDNKFAGGAISTTNNGLTSKGRELIRLLEDKKMIIDLSHSSVASAEQTLNIAQGPIIQSHGASRSIINNARCSPDHVIKSIADSGGVFGVFMMSWWLTYKSTPRIDHYIAHLKHIKNIAGAQSVAIANDYPLRGHLKALDSGNNNEVAIKGYDSWWRSLGKKGILGFDRDVNHIVIPELNHIKRMRTIEYALEQAKFTSREVDLVMGENWHRVLTEVLG